MPVVISFKNILEKQRSPLLRPLLTYLREIMAEHKQEVQGILRFLVVGIWPRLCDASPQSFLPLCLLLHYQTLWLPIGSWPRSLPLI